jgi:hypothetical protein
MKNVQSLYDLSTRNIHFSLKNSCQQEWVNEMSIPSGKNYFLIQSIHAKFQTEINKRRYTGSIPLLNISNIPSKLLLPIGFSKPIVRFFEAVNQDIPDCGSLHDSV